MPLITKARRRVKKPKHQQGLKPPTKENADSLAIAANHEQKFTRAFNKLLRNLLTPKMLRTITRAIREERTVEAMMNRIPFFDPEHPESIALWGGFAEKMEHIYTQVINESIENENRKRGWKTELVKIEEPTLPVNAGAAAFVRVRSLTRVVDISNKEAERVREILALSLESGAGATAAVAKIKATVGLTKKQVAQINRQVNNAVERAKFLAEQGKGKALNNKDIDKLWEDRSNKTRLTRAKTIARTETNDAMARGLTDSWNQAADAGLTPPGMKREWAAMNDESTSDICDDLDGQQVGLNENFSSAVGEGFVGPGPPAHPNCRSTLILIFPE